MTRTCDVCYEEFEAQRSHAKTCSDACRKELSRRRLRPRAIYESAKPRRVSTELASAMDGRHLNPRLLAVGGLRQEARMLVGVSYSPDSLRHAVNPLRRGFEGGSERERLKVQIEIERERRRILEHKRRKMLDEKIERELDYIGAASQEATTATSEVQVRVERLRELLHERYRPELADELEARFLTP